MHLNLEADVTCSHFSLKFEMCFIKANFERAIFEKVMTKKGS